MPASDLTDIVALFEPKSGAMPIVDPSLKDFGRLWIPLEHFECTKALRRFLGGAQIQPSLCMLHQKGHCNGGPKCNQAHVQLPFMRRIRQELQARPFNNCCSAHGDLASQRGDFQSMARQRPLKLKLGTVLITLAPEVLGMTEYFDCYIQEVARQPHLTRPILLDSSRICNLHQRQECKYGPDCRNIHLCRDFWASLPMSLTLNTSASVVPVCEAATAPKVFFTCSPLPASLVTLSCAAPPPVMPTVIPHPLIVPIPPLVVPFPAAAAPVPPPAVPLPNSSPLSMKGAPNRQANPVVVPAAPSQPDCRSLTALAAPLVPRAGQPRRPRAGTSGRVRNLTPGSQALLSHLASGDASGSDTPVTPSALTSEDVSSSDEVESLLHETQEKSPGPVRRAAKFDSHASVLDQQAMFQSLSSDLQGDAALGVDLPWNLINELKEMVTW